MRNRWNPLALGSAVQYLLVANLAVFVLQIFFQLQQGRFLGLSVGVGWFERMFGLTPACLTFAGGGQVGQICRFPFEIWQLGTYMFLHGGIWHIGFNMLALWMFGSLLERIWGLRRFLYYYLFCGIGAGLTVALTAYVWGGPYDQYVVTIGASGAVLGLLTAFGVMFPNHIIYMYFMPMKAKYAVWIFGGFSLLSGISGSFAGISHWGHLGGILFGLIGMNWRMWWARLTR